MPEIQLGGFDVIVDPPAGGLSVSVASPAGPVFEMAAPPPADVVVLPVAGPRGPAGAGEVHDQPAPASSWLIPHSLGRWPGVAVYDLTGALIEPDISVSDSSVSISFAMPFAGKAVLT